VLRIAATLTWFREMSGKKAGVSDFHCSAMIFFIISPGCSEESLIKSVEARSGGYGVPAGIEFVL